MKTITAVLVLMLLLSTAFAGNINSIYNRSLFLRGTSSAFNDGLVGFANPANLGFLKCWESRFYWSSDGADFGSIDNWGFFAGKNLGFGIQHRNFGDLDLTDYSLSLGFGDEGGALGLSYSWTGGDDELLGAENTMTLSAIDRPMRYLSFGISGRFSTESKWNELVGEIGFRPLGNSFLTLFADASWEYGLPFGDIPWSAGGALEILPGIDLFGRYFEDESFTAGLNISFGRNDFGSQAHFNRDQELAYYSNSVRTGGAGESILSDIMDQGKKYVPFDLKGRVVYNKYRYLDGGKHRFYDLLRQIKDAVEDPRVEVIALNLSGMNAASEHIWELRRELSRAKERGIKVVVFFERAGMRIYHLASVADYIAIDPDGAVALPGYILNRSYYREALDRLGIGVEEWRLFEYKSYMENYTRNSMSDADYVQRKAFVDDWYETVRDEICRSRGFTHEQYDYLIDSVVYFLPEEAIKQKLVDTTARWDDAGKIIREFTGQGYRGLSPLATGGQVDESDIWGERPQIAIVYALGSAGLDFGFNGRKLRRVFKHLAHNKRIKGVVFRIDSPGGDGMAADIVTEALRECAKKKPVVVSQGIVAASAGYWLSLYADTILAGPFTSSGSIGVIAGWVYDNGIGEKAGIDYDFAKRGEHADLSYGISLPFTNLRLPGRNLTEFERQEAEKRILAVYDSFVKKVADARGLSEDSVRVIAEGRSWSGMDAVAVGLVDKIGGMLDAVAIAEGMAGLKAEDRVEYLEIPDSYGLVNFSRLFKTRLLPSISFEDDPLYQFLKFRSEDPWRPLFMLPPGTYPDEEFLMRENAEQD